MNSPALRTRSKPTYCDDHITATLRSGGLEPLEPFKGVKEHRLCRCLDCGVEAHYRFEYTVDQYAQDVKTCRACFWRSWAESARTALGPYADLSPVFEADARAAAERGGLDYLQPLTAPSLSGDPHLTHCQSCGRIEATRLADMGWPCPCLKNPSRASVPNRRPGASYSRIPIARHRRGGIRVIARTCRRRSHQPRGSSPGGDVKKGTISKRQYSG